MEDMAQDASGGYKVVCDEDGRCRHEILFNTQTEAVQFANQGHACTNQHTIVPMSQAAATGFYRAIADRLRYEVAEVRCALLDVDTPEKTNAFYDRVTDRILKLARDHGVGAEEAEQALVDLDLEVPPRKYQIRAKVEVLITATAKGPVDDPKDFALNSLNEHPGRFAGTTAIGLDDDWEDVSIAVMDYDVTEADRIK